MNVWVSFLMSGVDDVVATHQSHSSSAAPACLTQSYHLRVVAMHFPAHLCRFPYLIKGLNAPGHYSGLAFCCQKSCLHTGFPKAFNSWHHRLYWRGPFQNEVVFWICCCSFCNRSVFFRDWVVNPVPNP